MDFFDGIGGGLFDGLLNIGGDLFHAGGGEALGDMLGNMAHEGFASESLFARFAGLFSRGTDVAFDYMIWRDLLGHSGANAKQFKQSWDGMGDGEKQGVESLSDTVKGHAFLAKQLDQHQNLPGVAELHSEYAALGLDLPSEDLTKRVYKRLSRVLHTDIQGTGNDEMFKFLGEAKDALENTDKRVLYAKELAQNPQGIEKLHQKIFGLDWQEVSNIRGRAERLMLTGGKEHYTGARQWIEELSPKSKGALAFGVVAGVGIGAYMLAAATDRHKPHTERVRPRSTEIQQAAQGTHAVARAV